MSDQALPASDVAGPGRFPVDVDVASDSFFFRDVTRDSLSSTAFLDGRTPFWVGESSMRSAQRIAAPGDHVKLYSLLRRVLDELDALVNVLLQAGIGSLKKLLLVVVGAADNIDGLLNSARLQRYQ